MIANSVCQLFPQPTKRYISLCFYSRVYNTFILILRQILVQGANKLKLPKTTPQVSIFHLPQFFFWTRNSNSTYSLIAMQMVFVRHIIPETDSGLVKLVVMTMSFSINSNTKLKLNGSYSLNISNLDPFATPETSVFIVHAKHENLSLRKTKFPTKFGSSAS